MTKKTILCFILFSYLFTSCSKKNDDTNIPDASNILVEEKNTSILNKLTATWCSPCGSWGWMMNEELIELAGDKAIPISTYNSGSSLFFTQTSVDLVASFSPYQGWPTFYVNGVSRNDEVPGGISYGGTKAACLNTINEFAEQIPVANTGFVVQFKGNQLSVYTKTKFFSTQDAQNEYYLAAYVIENNVMGEQEGKPEEVPHPHVLRTGLSENTYGVPIDIESLAGNEFSYTFTSTSDPEWIQENLTVITVIWRKMGDKYEFVNASRG